MSSTTLSCGCTFKHGEAHRRYSVEFDDWYYPRTLEDDGSPTPGRIARYFATWCEMCTKTRGADLPNFKATTYDDWNT